MKAYLRLDGVSYRLKLTGNPKATLEEVDKGMRDVLAQNWDSVSVELEDGNKLVLGSLAIKNAVILIQK